MQEPGLFLTICFAGLVLAFPRSTQREESAMLSCNHFFFLIHVYAVCLLSPFFFFPLARLHKHFRGRKTDLKIIIISQCRLCNRKTSTESRKAYNLVMNKTSQTSHNRDMYLQFGKRPHLISTNHCCF